MSAPSPSLPSRVRTFSRCAVPALAVVCLLASAAWACPGCKEALASGDGSGGDLVSGFFWSILFMLSMPFLIFGVLCTSMYVSIRRGRLAQAKAGTVAPAPAVQATPATGQPAPSAPPAGQTWAGA